MIGYKAFDKDMKCRGFQYEVGKEYEMDEEIKLCEKGFHFCIKIADCFIYYSKSDARFAKVEAYGDVQKANNSNKLVTNKIRILEEIPRSVAVEMTNSGHRNSGSCNSGDYNSGNWNSGSCNSGSCNSGDYNSGNWNSGDWNASSFNNGCFMSIKPTIMMFNKPTDWRIKDWWDCKARKVMIRCPIERTNTDWICASDMTEDEKKEHPEYETTNGHLKVIRHEADRQAWWNDLPYEDKKEVMSLPNFDADVFFKCTGIRVEVESEFGLI